MTAPIVFPDDMARGVVGLVAEIRDVLEEHASGAWLDDVPDTRVVVIDSNDELREVVEALVGVAVKHGAKA